MARRKVITTPMMRVYRDAPSKPYLGWGHYQTRKVTTYATSPKLLAYRRCIQGGMSGKTFGNPKEAQEYFRQLAHECKSKVSSIPSKKAKRSRALFY